jgi:hypothetical protein
MWRIGYKGRERVFWAEGNVFYLGWMAAAWVQISSSRAPALQVGSPEFKPQSHKKKKKFAFTENSECQ